MDYSLHPISNFLESKYHEYSKFVEDSKHNIEFIIPEWLENHVTNNLKENNVIYFILMDFCMIIMNH